MKKLDLSTVILHNGSHPNRGRRLNIMEAVAWFAGEGHSVAPSCACPFWSSAARMMNDSAWPSDKARTEAMLPMVPLLAGTRGTDDDERRRRALFEHLDASRWVPLALCAATAALEARGRDASTLRAAGLEVLAAPTPENAERARVVARAATEGLDLKAVAADLLKLRAADFTELLIAEQARGGR